MNKKELVEKVIKKMGAEYHKSDIEAGVNFVLGAIKEELELGKEVNISGFGIFKIVDRATRVGINPKTQERINIPASKSIKFQPTKSLKDKVKVI